MYKRNSDNTMKMVSTKAKHKVISCSTPERRPESPSVDSDSLCGSEAASPVPFLCTQDGAEGETDVVWNFYTPKADKAPTSRVKNSTPLSRKAKKSEKPPANERPQPKRRPIKTSQKKTELFQELIELNQNLHELMAKKSKKATENPVHSDSTDDMFSDSGEHSPKSGLKTNSRCLRRNVLSSKFAKPEAETALESDDSINECLIKASQVVEEKILNEPTPAKRTCFESSKSRKTNTNMNINIDNDSMDAILNSIKLESPLVRKTKQYESPKLNNDSFDNILENLNDSALDRLTQVPIKSNLNSSKLNKTNSDWTIQEMVVHDGSPLNKSGFGRHSSMPESPSVLGNKPSTSGMVFGRYNSMPHDQNGDSPIRCTPEEIKKKHQQAREKLLAKRLLPFTATQQSQQSLPATQPTKAQFQLKVASSSSNVTASKPSVKKDDKTQDLKSLIEKKRQEALMKLRSRQPQR